MFQILELSPTFYAYTPNLFPSFSNICFKLFTPVSFHKDYADIRGKDPESAGDAGSGEGCPCLPFT